MKKGKILDRRSYRDRRVKVNVSYTGPERRKFEERRSEVVTVCNICGEVCGDKREWVRKPTSEEMLEECSVDICDACDKRVPEKVHSL